MSTTKNNRSSKSGDDYLRLVQEFPLKEIRSKAELMAAHEALEPLMLRGDLSQGEEDYRDALGVLIAAYEKKTITLPGSTPHARLKHLVHESGMTVNQLGKVLGSQPIASLVLAGKRELSKASIRALADHFKVSPALFL